MKFSLRSLLLAGLILPILGSIIYFAFFPPPIPVVVAASDLDAFTQLDSSNTRLEELPAKTVSDEWIDSQNEITGKYIRYRASNGLPIFDDQYATFDEIVNDLRIAPSPQTNIVTVEWPRPEQGDIWGPGPPYGATINILQTVGDEKRVIARNVKVIREYRFSNSDYPNAHWLLGVELTDQQTISYIDAKQNGRIEIQTVSIDGG